MSLIDNRINLFFKKIYRVTLCALLVILSGCTWVKVNHTGKEVEVVSARHVQGCKKVGSIDVSTKDSLIGVKRSQKKIITELETLARNKATSIGADTLVAVDQPLKGAQSYHAYRCYNI